MSGTPVPRFSWRNVVIGTLIFLIPLASFAAWQCRLLYWNDNVDYGRVLTGYLKRAGTPTKLVEGFKDANGDMVADAPTDASKQLDPEELVFAPIAGSARDTEDVWRPFLDQVAKATGKKVTFKTFDVHIPQIEALNDGKLHITAFQTGFVPAAVNGAGFVPLVAMAKADGSYTYQVDLIVPTASTIKDAKDLKEKRLTVTGTGSHSGFKAPLVLLKDEFDLLPRRDYEFVISGGHTQSIKAVASKQAAAASVASDYFEESMADPKTELKPDQFRVIYHSKEFPRAAYGVNSRLKPELAAKIKDAFLKFDFKGTKLEELLRGSKTTKFVTVDYKKDWANVRSVEEKLLNWK